MLTFVGKLTGSISTSVSTALLPIIGLSYVDVGGVQTAVKGENTDVLIWAMFTLVPSILGILSAIPYIWYDLTGEKLNGIRSDMAERRAEKSKSVSGGENDA